MPGGRTTATSGFALELDGIDAGLLKEVAGGDAYADVVVEPPGRSFYAKKHVTTIKWTPLKLSVGIGASRALEQWIAATLTGNHVRKNGTVTETGGTAATRAARSFADAVISEVTVPACDGASKDPSYLTVALDGGRVTIAKAAGKPGAVARPKPWVASNFKLEIDGLDTTKVSRVEAFTIKQQILDWPSGSRVRGKEPTSVEFPNLTVTFAASSAKTWGDWFDDFVLKGNSGDAGEKNGTLRFLAANLKDELGQVRFYNLGIFKLAATPSPGTLKRMTAELYCERIELGSKT